MCNNNRPKLTPEQKMVNAVFHKVVGEDVYEEDVKSSATHPYPLDPDTQGAYMLTVARYIHFMADDLEDFADTGFAVDNSNGPLEQITTALTIMKRLVKGVAHPHDLRLIDQWEEYMSNR